MRQRRQKPLRDDVNDFCKLFLMMCYKHERGDMEVPGQLLYEITVSEDPTEMPTSRQSPRVRGRKHVAIWENVLGRAAVSGEVLRITWAWRV